MFVQQHMRALSGFGAMVGLAVLTASSPAFSQDRNLTIVLWGGAVQEHEKEVLLDPFTQDTGIAVDDATYNGEMAAIYAMSQANNVTWDVVLAEEPEMLRACEEGVLERLDWSRLDQSALMPRAVSECGAGSLIWGTVVGYDPGLFDGEIVSWADFWDVESFPGKRAMRSTAKGALEAALMADGIEADAVYDVLQTEEGQDRAFAKLDELRPNLVFYTSSSQPLQMLAAGDVTISTAPSGRFVNAMSEGEPYVIAWNTLNYAIDSLVIVSNTPKLDDAYALMDHWLSNAEGWADIGNRWGYGTTTLAANDLITNENALTKRPEFETALQWSTPFWSEYGEELDQRFARWLAR